MSETFEIKTARLSDMDDVSNIVKTTIREIYPAYYPSGAVEYFLLHHSDEKILKDIEQGNVYILIYDGNTVATVTIHDNEICRLFVHPPMQHKGLGRALMDFSEELILRSYDNIVLDASTPAKDIYLRRGYRLIEHLVLITDNGDPLDYDSMTKAR